MYIGTAVQFKHQIVSHKDKREVKRPADEHVRVEDAFPAIIDRETWAAVQAVNQQGGAKYAHRHAPQKRLFQGVLVCADCGAILSGLGFPKTYKGKRSVSISYRCGAYHATCGSVCSKHHISENALKQVVLGHIHRLAEKIALDEHMMLEALLSRLVGREAASKAAKARECRALKTRLRQLEGQTTRLYEDHAAGSHAGDSFSETLARYEAERLEKESRLSLLEQSAQEKAAKLADIKTWMRLIREKASIEDVDRELLDALVERIEVGEPSMVNGEKSQDIRIVFKLVGYMGGEMDGRASGGHVLPGRQRGAGGNEHAGKAPAGIRRKEPLPQPALLR